MSRSLPCCFLFLLLVAFNSLTAQDKDQLGLKDYYKGHFSVGVAVTPQALKGPERELILKHFNTLTAENAMKMGPIHPREDTYNWQPADEIADFAIKNGMKLRGHTLCWHQQTPDWIFKDGQGNTVSREVLLQRLESHITEVVKRYKGKIFAWDVVNEAIDDDDNKFLRESPWLTIIGEDYIEKAFQFAHAADPAALLFYNDYNTESPGKRERIFQLIKKLKDANVPIHGVGIQGHWSIYEPAEKEIRESIQKFSSLGLEVHVTELDVSVYQPEQARREKKAGESDKFTDEMQQKQLEQYEMIFRVLRERGTRLTNVTFWNISDRSSWLDNFPVRGRKNYPLLFDQDLKPKKAYWKIVRF